MRGRDREEKERKITASNSHVFNLLIVLFCFYSSSTQSVNSSIYDHVVENGRTYHRFKEGKYMLPNDEVPTQVPGESEIMKLIVFYVPRKSKID